MKYFVTFMSVLALASASANIFQIDLDPEEAAKYINNPPFGSPQLSARTNVLPLIKFNDPRFRSAEAGPTLGHYWKNGKEIENTDDYVEEVYDASQFHGQDGLGAYAYGYKAPESSKVENRQRSGDVTGSYTYKAPGYGGNDIQVRYWADSQGFHQEDNLPKYVPKQIEEAPEVKAARIAHEKAWNEAAYANLHPGAAAAQASETQNNYQQAQPTQNYQGGYQGLNSQSYQANQQGLQSPPQNYQPNQQGLQSPPQNYQANQQGLQSPPQNYQGGYQGQASQNYQQSYQAQPTGNYQQYQKSYDYQTQASEQQGSIVAAPGPAREGKAYEQNQGYSGQNQAYSGQNQGYSGQNQGYSTTTEPEPTGPPRGFFYSFNYPVSVIVAKNEAGQQGSNPGYPVDSDTVSQSQYGKK